MIKSMRSFLLLLLILLSITISQCGSPPTNCECYTEYQKWDKKQNELLTGIKNPYEEDIKLNYSLGDECVEIYKKEKGIKSESFSPKIISLLNHFNEKCN